MLLQRTLFLFFVLLGAGCAPYEASFSAIIGHERREPLALGVFDCPRPGWPRNDIFPQLIETEIFWADYVVPALKKGTAQPLPRQNPITVFSSSARISESKIIGEFRLRIEGGNDLIFDAITAEFPAFVRATNQRLEKSYREIGAVREFSPEVGVVLERRKPNELQRRGS